MLYELLCGCKPFTLQGNRLGELERAIAKRRRRCPASSYKRERMLAGSRGSAARRPARLRRELAGDLDNIVLMAMRKEAGAPLLLRRAVGRRNQRHLDGMPVLARADAWSYRAGKFLTRHAAVAALAAAFLALLIGFSVTTYLQSRRIAQERDVARGGAGVHRPHSGAPKPSPTS